MIRALTRSCRAQRVKSFAISNRFAGDQSAARSSNPCSSITRNILRFIASAFLSGGWDNNCRTGFRTSRKLIHKMKNLRPFNFLVLSLMLCGCDNQKSAARWGPAEGQIQSWVTNTVTGYYRTVDIRIQDTAADPKLWTAVALVEHYNKTGGIERENIPFQCSATKFWTVDTAKWFGASNGEK